MANERPEFFEVLGLAPPLTLDDVELAYREKAKSAHPDAGGDAEQFRKLQEAYERAKWINAEVRDKVLAAEARARAAKGKATATRAQGMSLPRGRGGDGGVPARDDLRSELREQMARSGVRVSE